MKNEYWRENQLDELAEETRKVVIRLAMQELQKGEKYEALDSIVTGIAVGLCGIMLSAVCIEGRSDLRAGMHEFMDGAFEIALINQPEREGEPS